MLVHFFTTTKAYILTLRVLNNYFFLNLLYFFILIFLIFFSILFI